MSAAESTLRSKRGWTRTEDEALLARRFELTFDGMASLLGRTPKAIRHRFSILKARRTQDRSYESVPENIVAYTAGIVDGEGHIGIARSGKYHILRVEVSTTSKTLSDFLRYWFGGSQYMGRRPNRKPYHRWLLASRQAETFLRAVSPFLVIKRDQAALAIRFREEPNPAIHEEMFREMKKLHRYE